MANESGVAAVERALTILDAFREADQSLTLTEISKRVGFYKSTTLRLAESLEKFGYLRRLEDGAFRLGPKPLLLGALYQKHFKIADFVPRVLRQIVEEVGESASFYVRDDNQLVCVHRVDSARSIRDAILEGQRMPLEAGAPGRIIRAFTCLPSPEDDPIRAQLFAVSMGSYDPEIAAIAAPVFTAGQRLAGTILVSGPLYRFEKADAGQIIQTLQRHCARLSEAFGARWPAAAP